MSGGMGQRGRIRAVLHCQRWGDDITLWVGDHRVTTRIPEGRDADSWREPQRITINAFKEGLLRSRVVATRVIWLINGQLFDIEPDHVSENEALRLFEQYKARRALDLAEDEARYAKQQVVVTEALARTLSETKSRRSRYIPNDVQAEVMRRDLGRCRRCGATEDLQFDHLVPYSRGGSNSADNLQVLCGTCNRKKGALSI